MNSEHIQVLIIGYVWPEPESSAAGRRMMELISLFESKGWKLTFASSAAKSEHMAELQGRGINTAEIEVNNSGFNSFIANLQPDIVLFDRFITEEQFGWRVAEQCPEAVRVLDTEDLHCLRRARKKAVKKKSDFTNRDLLKEESAVREIASIHRCDLSVMISEFEMELLIDFFGVDKSLLCYVPFMLDAMDEEKSEHGRPFNERKHFVTIGNFRHPPNWDSIVYLKEKVWPLVREQLPTAELHIYGAYITQKAQQIHNPQKGFYIEGRAKDAQKVVGQSRVLLAPLRFGAGLKGKLMEAMQCGTPSVTTEIGAEGIKGSLEWIGSIENDPEQIAATAVALYSDEVLWKKAQEQGVAIINERFADPYFGKRLLDRIFHIRKNLMAHRTNNFTGKMLLHHTMKSTEYMSRWIEEKNNK